MGRMRTSGVVAIIAALTVGVGADGARAGYLSAGYSPTVVKSEEGVNNAAAYCQTAATWTVSGIDTPVAASFTLPACQDVRFARLYLDVWGGSKTKTARATVTVNGTSLPLIDFGSTSDANPVFDAAANCVYGSGAGMWQLAYAGIADLLKTDGSANAVSVTISDPADSLFDGRMIGVSLVAIYQDASIHQTLDYYLAEADGTLRSAQPNSYDSPDQRTLTFVDLKTANVASATFCAGYTHGSTLNGDANLDQLYFNGSRLGPANHDATTGDTTNYAPNNLVFDVTGLLAATSTVRYSVNNTELGGTGDTYLRPNIALLVVTHPVPEPATLGLLALGGLALVARRRRRP